MGINLSVLPFRSVQDEFSERMFIDVEKQSGAERQTEGLIVNSSLLMGINLSVMPFRSVQDEFSEQMFIDVEKPAESRWHSAENVYIDLP